MKKALIPLCLLAILLTFSGCASKEEPMVTASPTASPTATTNPTDSPAEALDDMLPDMTTDAGDEPLTPTASEQPAAQGVTSVSDARKAIEDIEDELERLSEVDEAQVVIAGNDAAVALEFDSQYQGGIDDRLREIIKERIGSVISGVNNIAITSDATLRDQLETLGDRLEGAADMADIQNELNAIINKINAAKA
ncbi:MAG: YhcN/YlaJ family sporulation lipoprotein [Clostridia bacterium]|nr:YhcN/YlaJ family sporulation lipoprotein [Clostridia bacterium]MBQ7305244.1 YhcN/YlaJ family sporulation lipoprotein [Clostridia bacterium]